MTEEKIEQIVRAWAEMMEANLAWRMAVAKQRLASAWSNFAFLLCVLGLVPISVFHTHVAVWA